MISLIISLLILVLVIILTIYGINVALKSTVDTFLTKEKFTNYNSIEKIPNLDACKKLDSPLKNTLNTQTGTNIPMGPIQYNDHVGNLQIYKNKPTNELKDGCLCAYQNELLYDGIWKSEIKNKDNGFLNQSWKLTNGNILNDYVCSDKFIQLNKPIPEDYIDNSGIVNSNCNKTSIYFNDPKDDPLDLQINCFPSEFNKGMVNCDSDYK